MIKLKIKNKKIQTNKQTNKTKQNKKQQSNKPDSSNANPDCMVNMMNVQTIINTASTDSCPKVPPSALGGGAVAVFVFAVVMLVASLVTKLYI